MQGNWPTLLHTHRETLCVYSPDGSTFLLDTAL